MNICILQHVPFEGPGTILPYFQGTQHRVKMVHLYQGDRFPSPKWPDLLIVMGGPMGVHDENECSWLRDEKQFIEEVVNADTWVLGICLGAQLVASVLNAKVSKNHSPEIGWFPVRFNPELDKHWLGEIFSEEFETLHWHGDTFEIPNQAIPLGASQACQNQGYLWGSRVLGLQFHLEFTPESTALLTEKCADELVDAPWVQSAEQMLEQPDRFTNANERMSKILSHIEREITSKVELDAQLAQDCIVLAETNQLWVLLNKNASVPWFILVPKGQFRDLDDLNQEQHAVLFRQADVISDLLRADFGSEKINIAALGNMVPQLHLHVVGRTSHDPCWPNPVWGHLTERRDWTPEDIESLKAQILHLLDKR